MRSPAQKLFFWGMALMLIMACVPSLATPVPPLDPNAINTFIVQTADAALINTQAAMPPTLTFTPTLRSTFTPESTFTAVPIVTFPTSTPIQQLQYFRIKHDNQLAEFDYKSRTADNWGGVGLQTPEVISMFVDPRPSGGSNRTKVDGSWEVYIDALNNKDEQKLRYLKGNKTALFNGSGFPNLESITMGGNVITIIELQGGWGRVNTINYDQPGSLKDVNYMTRPDLVQKFVVVGWRKDTKTTYWVNPPPGSIYWPLVSSKPIWIPLDRLEPFPSLPKTVKAVTTQKIRKTPSTDGKATGLELVEGDSARIIEYYPSGSNVWGRLADGGWIALVLNWKYPTDWKMETLPPPL
jgi:hypothetical protein